jgi:hypothetical protein
MTPLLSSINNQAGVDYSQMEILLVNDGAGNALDPAILGVFSNLNARAILLPENVGPGMARQAGLDAARGEYVMFCDADDTLHSVGVVGALLRLAETSEADVVVSQWLEELPGEGGGFIYLPHEGENTWMHGKLFRREFLRGNGIAFHPELRVHEDSYFLAVASAHKPRVARLDAPSYVWRYTPDSITRRNGAAYRFSRMPEFIRAIGLSWDCISEVDPASLPERACQLACYIYFSLQGKEWQTEAARAQREASEAALGELFSRERGGRYPATDGFSTYWSAYNAVPESMFVPVYSQERAKNFSAGIESELFGEWVRRIRTAWDPVFAELLCAAGAES